MLINMQNKVFDLFSLFVGQYINFIFKIKKAEKYWNQSSNSSLSVSFEKAESWKHILDGIVQNISHKISEDLDNITDKKVIFI